MKKAILSAVVLAVLSGCGSDSSDPVSSPTPTPTPSDSITALFIDQFPVEGVSYECDTQEAGTTDTDGLFVVTDGALCSFSLDG